MYLIFALIGAAAATTSAPTPVTCGKVPAGQYYAWLSPGKYLNLEVAEDSASFITSLGDFAETDSEMDSDDEDRWVQGSKYLVSKVDFEMKPNCLAVIAPESQTSYWNLLRSLSAMIRICIHPGGFSDMRYDPTDESLRLGCVGFSRAKDGEVRFYDKTVVSKKDTVFVPRGVFTNYTDGSMLTVRVVDRATLWIKSVKDGETTRFSAGYEIVDGNMCLVVNKVTDFSKMMSVLPYLHEVSGANQICFAYSSEKRSLTLGGMEFKFEGVVPRIPRATRH